MSVKTVNRILLTGPPGIGKTTAIQAVCNILKKKNIPITGFYTKEVRSSARARVGFDIVTLDGKTGILARTKDKNKSNNSNHTIGNYAVLVNEFESLVVPLLKNEKKDIIIIIDEIGKMELFSRAFENAVIDLFNESNVRIIATIPVTKIKPIPFIEKLKVTPNTTIITVNHSNRDNIPEKILDLLNIR